MKFLIAFLILSSPAVAAESWYTAMTPLDPRPPLPKPSEPDGTGRDGPFRSPAPAPTAKPKAIPKAKPKAKVELTSSVTSKPKASLSGCRCEPCECQSREVELMPRLEPVETPVAKPKPVTSYANDPRLTRNADGVYFGTTPGGVTYYSTNAGDVVHCLNTAGTTTVPQAPPTTIVSFPLQFDASPMSFSSCVSGSCAR